MTFSRDVSKFSSSLRDVVKKAEKAGLLDQVGRYAIDLIVKRVRRGFGVKSPGGSEQKLKPLSKAYIKKRKKSALSAFTSPSKSNLTFTGTLLYSLRLRTKSKSITIGFDEARPDGKTNSEVARNVSKDRPFLNLSRDEAGKVQNFFVKMFDALVKNNVK